MKQGISRVLAGQQLQALRDLIAAGNEKKFYLCPEWTRLRASVLKLDNYECQQCKARGRYAKAHIVHHVEHLKARPDLALSIFDQATGRRQLVSLCKACHEAEHPEGLRRNVPANPPLTAERWD